VPIFIHRDDLAAIAPLWRDYTIQLKLAADAEQAFAERYRGVQVCCSAVLSDTQYRRTFSSNE
jgi:hypothetical protein